jgi:hypothetical protein
LRHYPNNALLHFVQGLYPSQLAIFRTWFFFLMLVKLLPLDLEEIIVGHIDVEGNSTKKSGEGHSEYFNCIN